MSPQKDRPLEDAPDFRSSMGEGNREPMQGQIFKPRSKPTGTGEEKGSGRLRGVPRKAMTPGQLAAAEVERTARAKREGVEEPVAVENEELVEDWQNDEIVAKPKIDPALAGLYRVIHGNLWLGPKKIVRGPRIVDGVKQPGRKVRLSAEDAHLFLEQGLIERLD
jgi:hypothetical protein